MVQRIAYEYARRGAVLVLIARREEWLVRVADNCVRAGAMDVRAIRADVSKEEDCRRFIDDTINQYGRCM
jgi:short-subunit dehydrogenase